VLIRRFNCDRRCHESCPRATIPAAVTFEGQFSNVTNSYAGKGVARYAWQTSVL